MAQAFNIDITLNTSDLSSRASRAAEAAARAAGEAVLRRAVALAPRRTGTLAASASVQAQGGTARVTFAAPYAAVQHEASYRHPSGGQSRYLAKALEDAAVLEEMGRAFGEELV